MVGRAGIEANGESYRLGIELAKTMSLNYSNQETSVTIGESVRDEDGMYHFLLACLCDGVGY